MIEAFLSTRPQQGFIVTVIVQAVVVLTMVAIAFGLVQHNIDNIDASNQQLYKTLPCYFALFALAEFYNLIMAIDALKFRNTIQLIGIMAFHVGTIIFSILQIQQTKQALEQKPGSSCADAGYVNCSGPGSLFNLIEHFLIVVPAVLGASFFVLLYFVHKLFEEFGWAVFHIVGADPAMRTMFRWYQILVVLLKLDFFCFAGLTMELLIVVLKEDSAEFIITIVAIPVVMILLVLCGIALKREYKPIMALSLVLMLASQAYVIYKFTRFFEPSTRAQYISTKKTLIFFSIITFILLFASFAVGLRCFADFDKGLKQAKTSETSTDPRRSKVYAKSPASPGMEQTGGYFEGNGNELEHRISIE